MSLIPELSQINAGFAKIVFFVLLLLQTSHGSKAEGQVDINRRKKTEVRHIYACFIILGLTGNNECFWFSLQTFRMFTKIEFSFI